MQKAIDAIEGKNPIVIYGSTYEMHDYFKNVGLFECGFYEIKSRYSGKITRTSYSFFNGDAPLRYRVNHGNGYITQHTWHKGCYACTIEDLTKESEALCKN